MASIPLYLSALITRVTESQNFTDAVEVFRGVGFAVDSWGDGGSFHTITSIIAKGITRLSDTIQEIAQGGYLDHSRGQWLTLLARSWFGVTRRAASYTYHTLQLTSAAGSPPYTIVSGQLWVSDDDDVRFNNTTGGVLASGGTLNVTIKAESPGADWNVAVGTITTMVVTLNGVTCTNTAVVTEGLDEETDAALKNRCKLRWATLAAGAPGAMYEFWALTESDGETAREGVTRAYADIDNPGGAGTVYVYLAGPEGAVDSGVVTDVDTDLQERRGIGAILTTLSTTETTVAPTGAVWVYNAVPAEVEALAGDALDEILADMPIGGRLIGGTRAVFNDEIADVIRGITGVVRVSITSGDHTMTATQVAVGDWSGLTFEAA